jgi:hypothetical protein
MKIACFFLLTLAALSAPLERKGSHYFIRDVFVEGQGPFRFLLDTGAEASGVSARVASLTGVRAEYRVEQVTAAGSRITPAGRARLRVGAHEVVGAEVLIGGLAVEADGVLGQSFLRHFDYLITRKTLELDAVPVEGRKIELREVDGLPAVRGSVEGTERDLVLDSGSPVLVMFGEAPVEGQAVGLVSDSSAPALLAFGAARVEGHPPVRRPKRGMERGLVNDSGARAVAEGRRVQTRDVDGSSARGFVDSGVPAQFQMISTNAGATVGRRGVMRMSVGGVNRGVDAVSLPGRGEWLLPLTVFRSVYVCNSGGYVVVK